MVSTETKKLYVVGDKMRDFSIHENVITITALENLAKVALTTRLINKYDIHIGQGVCDIRLKRLYAYINESGLSNILQINLSKLYKKSTPKMTHKRKNENIMISEPHQLDDTTYESFLMLADKCAEMSDHVSGKHIQGMVLIEAARQMVISVTEKYYIALSQRKSKFNFVTHKINTQFHKFLFPLSVSIQYKIIELKQATNTNLTSTAIIEFIQNGEIASEIIFKFSALDAGFMAEKESYLADRCIRHDLNTRNVA